MEQDQLAALSPVERAVVEIGLHDASSRWSAGPDGSFASRLRGLVRKIMGRRGDLPLADAKLELLRQFVASTHRRHSPDERLILALIGHGYPADRIRSLAAFAA
jgi:hypothetical protein